MGWQQTAPPVVAVLAGTAWLLVQHVRRDGGGQPDDSTRQAGPSKQQRQRTGRQQQQQQQPAGMRKQDAAPTPAADAIPQHELTQLQAFLRKCYRWRGWQGGCYHVTQAWHCVEAAAATAEGGGWQQQFTGRQLTDANCDALLRLIDTHFCAGKLLRRMCSSSSSMGPQSGGCAAAAAPAAGAMAAGSPSCSDHPPPASGGSGALVASDALVPLGTTAAGASAAAVEAAAAGTSGPRRLRCRVVQSWDAAWLAYFDTGDNAIYINCWRWAKEVSPDGPINCEGVVCTSRLQVLMHTLAHELVHAVVFHLFPDMDSSSPAYTINSRHGPIFHLLNKQLFGHSSDALENVHLLPRRRL